MTDQTGDVQRETVRTITTPPWRVYSQSEDEGWPEHMGWQGSIESSDKDADWVAVTIYNRADAALIAIAPDLLRLLTALVQADADAEVVPDVYANHVRQRWEEARDEARRLLTDFGRQLQAEGDET